MGELIAVISGKGGTGKTSVCAGIATALAKRGKSVLCIDCDIGLCNLDISLAMADSGALSFLDICEGNYSLDKAAENPYYNHLYLLTAPINYNAADVDVTHFSKMLQDASKRYDYVFLDAPAGIDEGFHLAAQFAGRILLVTSPDPAAMRDATRTGQILEIMGKNNVGLIVNRVRRKMISTIKITIDDIMDDIGLPLLGIVPEDPDIPLAAHAGRPLLLYSAGRKGAGKAFVEIADRMDSVSAFTYTF